MSDSRTGRAVHVGRGSEDIQASSSTTLTTRSVDWSGHAIDRARDTASVAPADPSAAIKTRMGQTIWPAAEEVDGNRVNE